MATKPNHSHILHKKGHSPELSSRYRFNRQTVLLVAGFVAVAGFVLLLAHAAGVFVAAEAESGTKSGPVANVADSGASGGIAIVFNAPTVTPPPPPTPPPTPPTGGVANCNPAKGYADELCWFQNTGVRNTIAGGNAHWSEAQILAGQASAQLAHVTANNGADANGVVKLTASFGGYTSGNGTAGNPFIYSNKWVDGCVDIQTNNVIIENVLVRHTNQAWWECHYGAIGEDATSYTGLIIRDTEVDGTYASCALVAPPRTGCTSPSTFNIGGMDMNIIVRPALVQRVNSHSGYAHIGYVEGDKIEDSYLHDQGHMHKFPQGNSQNFTPADYHHDIMWAQGQSNWSISHSFGTQWHSEDPLGGSSGGCLCDQNSSNWAFNDVFMDGGDNAGVAASNVHTKVVAQNVYGTPENEAYLGVWQNRPTNYSDYGAGAWIPAFTGTGSLMPVIDHSRCNGIYTVTKAGVATKVGC